ncbi:M66 family metalloprotease [Agromyces sp. CCNWLW203]|uniref:M66 family metalloprotease n=1 Tax=Agromyces sp. CCNWLW203 TaxID=3112842 RepID=UPI002F964A65
MLAAQSACIAAILAPLGVLAVEPAHAAEIAATSTDQLGFYDVLPAGTERTIRNDLTGSLPGMVQFAQSHTVNPSGNAAANLPTLVAERTALLLFTPAAQTGSVTVDVRVDGVLVASLPMADPAHIPDDDVVDRLGRPAVVYSERAWSVELPWNLVVPGLSLSFTDDGARTGTLDAAEIDFAAPTELVINGTELGMLTDPPTGSGHLMLTDPAAAGSDYFQTIPVSKLIIAEYEPVQLDRVIVASGQIYAAPSSSAVEGGVYSGDMREQVAKAQFSTGVNLASFGITSAPMNQQQPGTFNQRVYHHAAGLYTNGRVVHGLSGGNGMATLYDSVGNEWSHELGHSYGLGHYPGVDSSKTGDERVINATHHSESGWGYIDYRNRMRSNLWSNRAFDPAGTDVSGTMFQQNFAGQYNYQRDAMSGGSPTSDLSQYTHHTGYSAQRIQTSLRTVVPDAAYPSGYRDWDPVTGEWIDAKVRNAAFSATAPAAVGVPVTTLLGGYNPAAPAQTLLYPGFRSNYGNVFDHPAVTTDGTNTTRVCWAEITYLGGSVQTIGINASDGVKQVNINLATSADPRQARLLCRTAGATTQLGDVVSFDTERAPMPPAVVIGQEHGYDALRAEELAELETALTAMSTEPAPVPDASTLVLLDSWGEDLSGLSPEANAVADRITQLRAQAAEIDEYVASHQAELSAGRKTELHRRLTEHGFVENADRFLPTGSQVTVDGGRCLALDLAQPVAKVVTTDAAGCADVAAQRWFIDVRGALHSAARPGLCVVAATPVGLAACELESAAQQWRPEVDGHLQSVAEPSKYLDLYRQTGLPGLYGRASGANQLWIGLQQSANPAMALLASATLSTLFETADHRVLSELPRQLADNGWGPVEIDESNGEQAVGDGGALSVAGTVASHGFGVHADSVIEIVLPAGCTRLTGSAGVDDETAVRGSVVMSLVGDGAELWTSPTLRGGEEAAAFDLDLTGVGTLRLVTGTTGDGDAWDHADWLAPTLTCTA